jgi:hypothetical protein
LAEVEVDDHLQTLASAVIPSRREPGIDVEPGGMFDL